MTTIAQGLHKRDYSVTGPEAQRAVERGLAAAEWYHTDIAAQGDEGADAALRRPAIRDNLLWLGLMVAFGRGRRLFLGHLVVRAVLCSSTACSTARPATALARGGHGTAFKTQWMNEVVYQIACFMIMRNPVTWRWSHARHHTDTIIVGRDPEIAVMRPPDARSRVLVLNFFGILDVWYAMSDMLRNAAGNLSATPRRASSPRQSGPRWSRAARVAGRSMPRPSR
jgi:fatty acid desaturase